MGGGEGCRRDSVGVRGYNSGGCERRWGKKYILFPTHLWLKPDHSSNNECRQQSTTVLAGPLTLPPGNHRYFHYSMTVIASIISAHQYCGITVAWHKNFHTSNRKYWTPLVAQWLRICLPVQGTRVRALVREDPTCHGATKPVRHNYWACALEPASHNY